MVSYSPNIITLCLDFYDRERQSGRMYHLYTSCGVSFSTLFEAFDRMDRLYDELLLPQAALRIRSFRADRRKMEQAIKRERMPKLPDYTRKEMKIMEEFNKVTEQRGMPIYHSCKVQAECKLAGRSDMGRQTEKRVFSKRIGTCPSD